jgi:hypothetical protein
MGAIAAVVSIVSEKSLSSCVVTLGQGSQAG